jgi:hypothetical protein
MCPVDGVSVLDVDVQEAERRTWWSMTKMQELLQAWSGASTATVDLVTHTLLLMHHDQLLVGLA